MQDFSEASEMILQGEEDNKNVSKKKWNPISVEYLRKVLFQ